MSPFRTLMLGVLLFVGTVAVGVPGAPAAGQSLLAPKATEATEEPGPLDKAYASLQRFQGELQRDLVAIIKDIKDSGRLAPVLFLVAMSFLYGVFHAAGPGHGKIVISSYLLTHGAKVGNGVLIAFAAAFVQACSAILLVGALAILLDLPRLQVTGHARTLEIASYGLIIALGIWMLVAAVRGRGCDHGHGHAHDGSDDGDSDGTAGRMRRLGRIPALVLAIGVRPCTGAIIVLLFTLANGLLVVGVVSTFAMAVGVGITVSLLGVLSVFGHRLTLKVGQRNPVWERRLRAGLTIAGSLFITVIGATLLLSTLDRTGPL